MKHRAAAKGRTHLLLAAVCVLASLLVATGAEASRSLPAALAPALEAPVAPARVLKEKPAEPQPSFRLFDDLSLPERPLELVQIQKTATGVSTCGLRLNIWQTGDLSQNCSGPSFQGLWTDPVTGISYARNRWYDARTASWLSEDPKGAIDSPNLYAFVGWGPHAGRDPMGLSCLGLGNPDLSCSESLHIGEGYWATRRRELISTVDDQTLTPGERWLAALKVNSQIPLYFAEELVRGVPNTPSRFVGHTEAGNEHVNKAFDAGSTSERIEECSRAVSSYCFAFVEGAGAAEGVRALVPKNSATKALVPGEAVDEVGLLVDDAAASSGALTERALSYRRYIREAEQVTGTRVTDVQRQMLVKDLQQHSFSKLSAAETAAGRRQFNRMKNRLIEAWEEHTGQTWPRYTEDIPTKAGTGVLRRAGQPYDAHHIIELSEGGPNVWWNLHPAAAPADHAAVQAAARQIVR